MSEWAERMQAALARSAELANTNLEEALALLDARIEAAEAAADARGRLLLARHAGVLCSHHDEHERTARYWRLACQLDTNDGWGRLGLAQVLEKTGDAAGAADWFAASQELAKAQGDGDLARLAAEGLARTRG